MYNQKVAKTKAEKNIPGSAGRWNIVVGRSVT